MSATSRQLALSTEHTDITIEMIEQRGITYADLSCIAVYLTNLTEYGQHLAALASKIFETAEPGHPLSTSPHGTNADIALAHFTNILEAAHEFASQTERELKLTASNQPADDA